MMKSFGSISIALALALAVGCDGDAPTDAGMDGSAPPTDACTRNRSPEIARPAQLAPITNCGSSWLCCNQAPSRG